MQHMNYIQFSYCKKWTHILFLRKIYTYKRLSLNYIQIQNVLKVFYKKRVSLFIHEKYIHYVCANVRLMKKRVIISKRVQICTRKECIFFIHEKINMHIQRGTISKCIPNFIWKKKYIYIHYNTI